MQPEENTAVASAEPQTEGGAVDTGSPEVENAGSDPQIESEGGDTASTSEDESQNSLPKTAATSAVTSDLPSEAGDETEAQIKAFEEAPAEHRNSIGLIKVDGGVFQYVGVSPGRDENASTDTDLSISTLNSTFTPLAEVPFNRSIRVKDPKSRTFYFPGDDCTSWKDCQLDGSYLIER